jgi:hypothetical protein
MDFFDNTVKQHKSAGDDFIVGRLVLASVAKWPLAGSAAAPNEIE